MCEGSPDRPIEGDVRCPTCGAWQAWSDVCRRCKCELTLLRRATDAAQANRRRCLRLLRAGRVQDALRYARRWYAFSRSRPAARLLAVCHLLQGDWMGAVTIAQIADR